MSENDEKSWEMRENEPNLWFQRFEKYRLLGPERSVLGAYNSWRAENERDKARSAPNSWRSAAVEWDWQMRAEAWDKHLSVEAARIVEEERLKIITSGYALQHERIRDLDWLAKKLKGEIEQEDKFWLPDQKAIGSGENQMVVDIVRFNGGLITKYLDTLNDIALEMGERVKGMEIAGKGGGPIEFKDAEEVRSKRWSKVEQSLARVIAEDNFPEGLADDQEDDQDEDEGEDA